MPVTAVKEWFTGGSKKQQKPTCKDRCSIKIKEAECYDIAWKEWFESGHEFGLRDRSQFVEEKWNRRKLIKEKLLYFI